MSQAGVEQYQGDGGVGGGGAVVEGRHAKIGVSQSGTNNVVTVQRDPNAVATDFGEGPLADSLRQSLLSGAREIYAVKADADVDGTVGATAADAGNGGDGTLASGLSAGYSSPLNAYDAVVEIVDPGEQGVATFRYSLDGGDTWSQAITVPVGAPGVYDIPNTGVKLSWADGTPVSFQAGDKWTFTCTQPTASSSSIIAAIDALLATPYVYEFIHVVGPGASALWTALQTKADALVVANKFLGIVVEWRGLNSGETVAQWQTAYLAEVASFVGKHICVVVGRCNIVDPITLRQFETSAAGIICGRLSKIPVQAEAGRVADGPLPMIAGTSETDSGIRPVGAETYTSVIDDAYGTMLTTHPGKKGVFVNATRLSGGPGSDYQHFDRRRTMDKACRITLAKLIERVNDEFAGDQSALDAVKNDVEGELKKQMRSGARPNVVAVGVTFPAGQDVLSSGILEVETWMVPVGHTRRLKNTLRFVVSAPSA